MQSSGGCHVPNLECCHLRGITMILSITFLLLFHFRASQAAKSHRCSCMAALFVAKWRHTWRYWNSLSQLINSSACNVGPKFRTWNLGLPSFGLFIGKRSRSLPGWQGREDSSRCWSDRVSESSLSFSYSYKLYYNSGFWGIIFGGRTKKNS